MPYKNKEAYNSGIAHLKENIAILKSAIEYLVDSDSFSPEPKDS